MWQRFRDRLAKWIVIQIAARISLAAVVEVALDVSSIYVDGLEYEEPEDE
jgi:hypothetical protein